VLGTFTLLVCLFLQTLPNVVAATSTATFLTQQQHNACLATTITTQCG
jgi:hypothetical protein